MSQLEKAKAFAALHQKGDPVVFYNIWDAGSAKAVERAGAKALATGSASVAGAQGYEDGQKLPLDFLLMIVERIVATSDLPLTVDFEGGYAVEPDGLETNIARLIEAGAIGLNFEDQRVGEGSLYPVGEQARRITAIRKAADAVDIPLFINARTDLFLKEADQGRHAGLTAEAVERANAYAEAGASSFFIPGLKNIDLITEICRVVALPVNVMYMGGPVSIAELAKCGVARISCGPWPYRNMLKGLAEHCKFV